LTNLWRLFVRGGQSTNKTVTFSLSKRKRGNQSDHKNRIFYCKYFLLLKVFHFVVLIELRGKHFEAFNSFLCNFICLCINELFLFWFVPWNCTYYSCKTANSCMVIPSQFLRTYIYTNTRTHAHNTHAHNTHTHKQTHTHLFAHEHAHVNIIQIYVNNFTTQTC